MIQTTVMIMNRQKKNSETPLHLGQTIVGIHSFFSQKHSYGIILSVGDWTCPAGPYGPNSVVLGEEVFGLLTHP